MPVGQVRRIFDLELSIIQREHITVEEARQLQTEIISCRDKFLVYCGEDRFHDNKVDRLQHNFQRAECIHRITVRLLEKLKKFMEPAEPASSTVTKVKDQSNANNQSAATVNLHSLLRKQDYYNQMIDSLKPEGELSPKQAQLRFEHVSQAYDKFTSNQSEIMTCLEDTALEVQVNILKDIQHKVLSFQEKLNEIFSLETSTGPAPLLESKKNAQNRSERPNYIVNFLDSRCKKPELPIKPVVLPEPESKADKHSNRTGGTNGVDFVNSKLKSNKRESVVEPIESKSEPDAAEEETLQDISQSESSVENQAKIETCETGSTSGNSSKDLLPSVEEVCSSYGLNDVKIEYNEADFQNLTSYKSYAQHVRPILAQKNPKVSIGKLMMLVAAQWRDFSSRNPNIDIKLANSDVDKDPDYIPRETRTRTPKTRSKDEIYEYDRGEEIETKKNRRDRSKKKSTKKSTSNSKASSVKIKLGKRTHENSDEDDEGSVTKHPQVLVPILKSDEY